MAEIARNAFALAGLDLAARRVVDPAAAWLPGVALVVISWLMGSGRSERDPSRWALVLHPIGAPVATAVLLCVGAVGLGWFVVSARRAPRSVVQTRR